MNVRIVAVGKLKKDYIREGVCDYRKRLSKYINIELIEVKDEKAGDKVSKADCERIKNKEGERIIQAVTDKSFVICLDVKGNSFSTEELACFIKGKKLEGAKELCFVIGGHLGLGEGVIKRADLLLSVSEMTFPHEMARLMLFEQLYRAEKILSGEPYHK